MADFSELYSNEVKNIVMIMKRAFNIDFNVLNKDHYMEEISNNFEDDKVLFEDLDGNPLKLQHLVNLNESFKNAKDKLSTIFNKSIFNLKVIRPWNIQEYQNYFLRKFITEKEYKSLFLNSICYIDGKFRMRGFAKSDRVNHLKILKIERNSKIILKSSNKIKISELLNDPRFKSVYKSVDATYLFPNGEVSVKWQNCFNVFDWPDLLADCDLKITIDPFSTNSSLNSILKEIQQLEVIYKAVENDESSWELIDNEKLGLNVDKFKIELEKMLKLCIDKAPCNSDENINIYSWNRNVFTRNKDITEKLWAVFHKINSKAEFKKCVNSMMPILTENYASVEFNPNNTTELCRMLKDRFLNSEVLITSFMTNLELIVQVGLHKLTKDLLFIIFNELPDLLQDERNEIYNKCCKVTQLGTGIESLKQFFTCVSYMEILKTVLNPQDYKVEALAAVRRFLKSLSSNNSFDLEQSIKLKMREINPIIRTLSSFWIVHFECEEPMHCQKAVVFEVENNNAEFHIYRHDMELCDMPMFSRN